jgi:hypothetical protein
VFQIAPMISDFNSTEKKRLLLFFFFFFFLPTREVTLNRVSDVKNKTKQRFFNNKRREKEGITEWYIFLISFEEE